MHNKPFHAPVKKPTKILDIGCGTGAMTFLLAQRFPNAEVIGLDISPVPKRHEQPSNLTYIQGDIMELTKANDSRLAAGTFDYIFSRLLLFGMTDWPGYVKTVHSLLQPGGWAELQDFDLTIFDSSGKRLVDEWWYYPYFVEDCRAIGLDLQAGSNLAAHMRNAEIFHNGSEKHLQNAHPCGS